MNVVKKIKRLMKRGLRCIKRDGLWATFKKVIRVFRYKLAFRNMAKQLKLLQEQVDLSRFQSAVIFENNFGWNKIMKQRPQQIAYYGWFLYKNELEERARRIYERT